MAFLLADDDHDFGSMRQEGFEAAPPRLLGRSKIGARLNAAHTVRLDDPLAATRYTAEEIEFWRDAGIYYFVPCIAKDAAIAVLALGRRESGEPLSSEDLALVTAVAAQAATAIENGRLYRQLRIKASELDRLHAFNENILESLDDGLLVVGAREDVVRWNAALERQYGHTRREVLGKRLDALFDSHVVDLLKAAWREHPEGTTLFRVPLQGRGSREGERLLVNITTVPLQSIAGASASGTIVIFEDITERSHMEEQLRISEKMASLGLLAAGVAHEVNTPLTGISSYTQMLLEGADPADPRTPLLEKIEKQTFRAARIVNGLLNLSRPSAAEQSERGIVDLNVVIGDVLSLLEHQFEKGSIKVRRELSSVAREHRRLRVQAAAGLPQPLPECAGRDGQRRLADDCHPSRRGRSGGRGVGHGQRHRARAPGAHLRPVLHDQVDRPGHRARVVDHLRHRARARGHHSVRQHAGPGDAVRAPVCARAFVSGGAQRTTDGEITCRETLRFSSSTTRRSCVRSSARCWSARATACGWPRPARKASIWPGRCPSMP